MIYSHSMAMELHIAGWSELSKQYGRFEVPLSEIAVLSERVRAIEILALNNGEPGQDKILRQYAIPETIIKEMEIDSANGTIKKKRVDKAKTVTSWLKENVGAQITGQQLAEIGEFSYTHAMKMISDNVGIFSKIKRGLYEVRDPEAERARDRAK